MTQFRFAWPVIRDRLFREVFSFSRAHPADGAPSEERPAAAIWVGRRASWREALLGALPFLLFGLAYLLDGLVALGGSTRMALPLLDDGTRRPAVTLTLQLGVYFACALGLLSGVWKGFRRWTYAYLGMALYFGWSYNQQNYYGLFYRWWVWLPLLAAVALGLLLARSLNPLVRLGQSVWNDWTRLSFALYAFAVPMFTVIFFDGDWGVRQLYGLIFDTVLLAAAAVTHLRARTTLARITALEAAVIILVFKLILTGGYPTFATLRQTLNYWLLLISLYLGFLLLPALITPLRRAVKALLPKGS